MKPLSLLRLKLDLLKIHCMVANRDNVTAIDDANETEKGDHWISTETGSHILLDGEGNIKGGMGGKFTGKNIKDTGGTKKFTKYETNAEREQAKQPAPEAKQSSENESSNSLTKEAKENTLSSTSQNEAANGDKTMKYSHNQEDAPRLLGATGGKKYPAKSFDVENMTIAQYGAFVSEVKEKLKSAKFNRQTKENTLDLLSDQQDVVAFLKSGENDFKNQSEQYKLEKEKKQAEEKQAKRQAEEKSQAEYDAKEAKRQVELQKSRNDFKLKASEAIEKHGESKVMKYLTDAYLGNSEKARKVMNGEIAPTPAAERELSYLSYGDKTMSAGKIINIRPMPHLPEMATVQIDGGKHLNSKGEPSVMPYHFDNEQDAQKALDYYDNVYNTPEARSQRDNKKQAEKQAEIDKANEKKAKTAQKTAATKTENKTRVHLTGNTYDIKEELKSLFKAKWDNDAKKWNVPSEHEKAAKQFIADHEDNLAKKQAEKQAAQQKTEPRQQKNSIHRRLSEMSSNSANNRDIMERLNRDNARNKLAQKEFMNPWDE